MDVSAFDTSIHDAIQAEGRSIKLINSLVTQAPGGAMAADVVATLALANAALAIHNDLLALITVLKGDVDG